MSIVHNNGINTICNTSEMFNKVEGDEVSISDSTNSMVYKFEDLKRFKKITLLSCVDPNFLELCDKRFYVIRNKNPVDCDNVTWVFNNTITFEEACNLKKICIRLDDNFENYTNAIKVLTMMDEFDYLELEFNVFVFVSLPGIENVKCKKIKINNDCMLDDVFKNEYVTNVSISGRGIIYNRSLIESNYNIVYFRDECGKHLIKHNAENRFKRCKAIL